MKIFDFSSGKKGKVLGESLSPTQLYGHPTMTIGSKRVAITLSDKALFTAESHVDLYSGASRYYANTKETNEKDYRPETWNTTAIVFCLGKFKADTGVVWEWAVVATNEWLESRYDNSIVITELGDANEV